MARSVHFVLLLAMSLSIASSAVACPFCESSTAEQVRAGIFNAELLYNLGVLLAPFSVLLATLFLMSCWPAPRARRLKPKR